MAGYKNSKAIRPQAEDVVAIKAEEERADIWTSLPGKVVSYDEKTQRAKIKPQYKPRHNGKPVDMPDLPEVRIMFQGGQSGVITMPVKEGDDVWLSFSARDFSTWDKSGEASEAPSARMHDLSDAVAFLGGWPTPRELKDVSPDAIEFRNQDGTKKMSFNPATGAFKTDSGAARGGSLEFKGMDGEELLTIIRDFIVAYRDHTNLGSPMDATKIDEAWQLQFRIMKLMGIF